MGLDRQTAKQPVGQISTVVGLSATKSGSECDTNPGFRGCLLVADTVAKVENRTRPKISRMLIIRPFCRCGALSAATKVRGRFWVKRYGPSRRRARNASAAFRIFDPHPKKTFATVSANTRHCTLGLI